MSLAPHVVATITTAAAVATPWQAVIVGAGPAGSATAIALAREGWRVLLVDRCGMPRPKVCGCCLSMRARAELQSLFPQRTGPGILGEAPLDHVRVVAAGRSLRLPLPAGGVLSREILDTRLVQEAIAAGASWLPGIDVTVVAEPGAAPQPLTATFRLVHAASESFNVKAGCVVIAAGLVDHVRVPGGGSTRRVRPRSRVGIGGTLPAAAVGLAPGELVMAVGRSGYCGLVRLEDGRVDVAAALDRRALAAGGSPAVAIGAVLDEAAAARHGISIPAPLLATAGLRATPALSHTAPLVGGATRRVFRVGDAAAYVEPFTGEGMGWALSSGRLLAAALLGADDPATAYERSHAACFDAVHGRCRRIAAVLRHPRLVGSAIRAATAVPWAARRLVPLVVGAAGTGASR